MLSSCLTNRRVRVNRGLALWHEGADIVVRVVGMNEDIPTEAQQFITTGMLCEAQRAGNTVRGIVGAVHSSTRLTLLVPGTVSVHRIVWHRVIVSPRSHGRIISTDSVLFLPLPTDTDAARDEHQGERQPDE